METYTTNQVRGGVKILVDGDPCNIIECDFVKPGKGQAFTRIRFRNLITGRVIERTFKSAETLQGADVVETEMQYLYADGEFWYFMSHDNYEQVRASATAVDEARKWLKEQDVCMVTLWNGSVISVTPPTFVVLTVAETEPGIRGDTAGTGGKSATLETGAVVRVPLFIEVGERLKLDTRTGEYVGRVKA